MAGTGEGTRQGAAGVAGEAGEVSQEGGGEILEEEDVSLQVAVEESATVEGDSIWQGRRGAQAFLPGLGAGGQERARGVRRVR